MFHVPVNMLWITPSSSHFEEGVTWWEMSHKMALAALQELGGSDGQVPPPWLFLQGNVPAARCWEHSLVCVWAHTAHRTQRSFLCACKAPLFSACPDVNLWLACRMLWSWLTSVTPCPSTCRYVCGSTAPAVSLPRVWGQVCGTASQAGMGGCCGVPAHRTGVGTWWSFKVLFTPNHYWMILWHLKSYCKSNLGDAGKGKTFS